MALLLMAEPQVEVMFQKWREWQEPRPVETPELAALPNPLPRRHLRSNWPKFRAQPMETSYDPQDLTPREVRLRDAYDLVESALFRVAIPLTCSLSRARQLEYRRRLEALRNYQRGILTKRVWKDLYGDPATYVERWEDEVWKMMRRRK